MTIFVSTGGERGSKALDTAQLWLEQGITDIELSGGSYDPFFEEKLDRLVARGASVTLHNYLPLKREPFVINLASQSEEVFNKSFSHVQKCIELSEKIGAKHYAVHAGFLLDPKPRQLGGPLKNMDLFDRTVCENTFVMAVKELGELAERKNIRLLIENNVYSSSNKKLFKHNPLLMTDPNAILEILYRCEGAAGLLLDVAHLKVSSISQGFDAKAAVDSITSLIEGLHLSDNDGLEDQNERCAEDSWFWPVLPKVKYHVLEVYGLSTQEIKKQLVLASNRI
ncbi:sugar phosphate isomerase/epimerase [Luminiphilus sp.]|nr:sugar phosphate isomerase/epimerase [Luminiphilus sp.]